MRKFLALLILLAAGAWAVFAETKITLAPVITFSHADLHEFVYLSDAHDKLSQLDWDVHNVVQYGVKTELDYNRLIVTVDAATATQSECGYMQDYDWLYLYVQNPEYPVTTLTEFSEHPVTLLEKRNLNLNAAWKVLTRSKFSLALGGGFQYLFTSLEGHDGYLQHSAYVVRNTEGYTNENVHPYDPSRPKEPGFGKVIAYQQEIESLWLDVRADIMPFSWLTLIVEGGISPWQMIDCYDFHYATQTTGVLYNDKPLPSLMYRAALTTLLNVTKRSSLAVEGSVLSLPFAEGNDYINNSNVPTAEILGGTGYFGWDVSFSYRIRIF